MKLIGCGRKEKASHVCREKIGAMPATHRNSLEQACARNTHLIIYSIIHQSKINKLNKLRIELKCVHVLWKWRINIIRWWWWWWWYIGRYREDSVTKVATDVTELLGIRRRREVLVLVLVVVVRWTKSSRWWRWHIFNS